jgi:hypothetical protein
MQSKFQVEGALMVIVVCRKSAGLIDKKEEVEIGQKL